MARYGRLAALIGAGRVMSVILTARLLEADEAARIGLMSEVPEAFLAKRCSGPGRERGAGCPCRAARSGSRTQCHYRRVCRHCWKRA